MAIVLYGTSALAYLATIYERPLPINILPDDGINSLSPDSHAHRYLHERLPQIAKPYHLAAISWKHAPLPDLCIHQVSHYPFGTLLQIGRDIYVSSPELCFTQIACDLSFLETIMLGGVLCGSFALDPTRPSGLGERNPLTSIAQIRAFLDKNPGRRGAAIARSALRFLPDKAASPPEVFLRMVLTLPGRYGGFGIPGSESNCAVSLSKRAQKYAERSYLVPDLLWPEAKLIIEYDSNAEHLAGSQVTADAKRRMALETDGYTLITVTTRQLARAQSMKDVAEEACRRLGRRCRTRSQVFEQRQAELFSLRRSLNDLVNPHWMHQTLPTR